MRILTLIIITIILSTIKIEAQGMRYGIELGPQLSPNFTWRAGVNVDAPINNKYSIETGLYLSSRFRKSTSKYNITVNDEKHYKEEKTRLRANFLTLPIRFAISFANDHNPNNRLRLLVGPYLAYGVQGNGEVKHYIDGVLSTEKISAFGKDGLYKTRWDYGLNTEVQYIIQDHFKAGLYAEIGARKLYKETSTIDILLGKLFITNKINLAAGLSLGYVF